MKIKKFEDFVLLLEYYTEKKSFDTLEDNISLNGIALYKNYLFEAIQDLKNKTNLEQKSPLKTRLYAALEKLSEKEQNTLIFSTLTSYFTPSNITQLMSHTALDYFKKKEIKNISILEPSAGSGNFIFSLLSNNSQVKTQIDAIELDILTSKILQNNTKIFDNVNVKNMAYQDFTPNNTYELIIGNIPFGQFDAFDKEDTRFERELVAKKVHNQFFIKAMRQLKPGGILMFITSKELLDNSSDKNLRKYLLENLNLITSVRFSDDTFKEAGTRVVTDLLVLQKPIVTKENLSIDEMNIIDTSYIKIDDTQQSINKYYIENPENILGDFYSTTGIKGKDIISVKGNNNDNLKSILLNAFQKNALHEISFQENKIVSKDLEKLAEEQNQIIIEKYPFIVPGNLIIMDSNFFRVEINSDFDKYLLANPIEIKATDRERAYNLIELREAYKTFRNSLRNNNIEQAKIEQATLNNIYDNYSFFYNTINSKENRDILFLEAEREILKNLEKEITPGEYQKSDIFSQNELFPRNNDVKINSVEEAVYLSINKFGKINENYISDVYKKEKNQWISEALEKNVLFINPVFSKDYMSLERYELSLPSTFTSGFIEGKISIYNKILSSTDEKLLSYKEVLSRTVIDTAKAELIKNIPYKLSIQEIDPSLGEPWIDKSVFELFGKEHLQDEKFKIYYNETLDNYKVITSGSTFGTASYSVKNERKVVSYKDIFLYALVQNIPEFSTKILINGKEQKVSDKEFNTSLQVTVEKLQNAFTEWLMTKEKICQALENKYHILNNAIVREKFNADLLSFDNIKGYSPYLHQKSVALELSIQNGGIIDHSVGYGKTLSMAMLCMTKKKFKINKKELIVGLNANYIDLYNAFSNAYPEGKFLLVTRKDIDTIDKKKELFYKIANNSYDAVITSHSCINSFPRAPYTELDVIGQIIDEAIATIESTKDNPNFSPGEMNKLLKKVAKAEEGQKEILHILNQRKESGSLIFDDLGFDGMTIDESHYFKNLEFATRHTRVAGLGSNSEVQKTRNILSYIRNIQKKNNGIGKYGGITFATGTTISNSISELYTLFKYLIPEELKLKGMNTFDQWARVYARKSYEYEESVTGQIKLKERFRYFVKVPELAKMYYDMTNFADEKTFKVEKPDLKFEMVTVQPYPELESYLSSIKKFGNSKNFSDLKYYKGETTSSKAVGLICTSLGRKASLSLKLIDAALPDNENDKINTAIRVSLKYYEKYNKEKGTQIIFCDQGVPNTKKDFDIYNYTRDKLVSNGIPREEIAFIHEYDKRRQLLYGKVNRGEIRYLLASTEKGGVGVNVQEKLVALHHFDLPWRPSDLDQRNGRGGRPGNLLLPKFDNIMPVFFYATKNTLDSYNFNILQIKNNFISQIKNASISSRKIDEGAIDSDGSMNFQEYMAACSSNQYLTEKLKVEKELQRVLDEKASFELRDRQNRTRLNYISTDLAKTEKNLLNLEKDLTQSVNFNPKIIDGVLIEDTNKIAELFNSKLEKIIKSKTPGVLVELDKEFKLVVDPKYSQFELDKDNYSISLKSSNNVKIGYKSKTFTKKAEEVCEYSLNCIKRIQEIIKEQEKIHQQYFYQKENIKKALNEKFIKEDKIFELKETIVNLERLITEENKKNDIEKLEKPSNQIVNDNNLKPNVKTLKR